MTNSPSDCEQIERKRRTEQAFVISLEDVLTPYEVDYVNQKVAVYGEGKESGKIGEGKVVEEVRTSEIIWLKHTQNAWLYEKIWHAIKTSNDEYWQFDIMRATPSHLGGTSMQYTEYYANDSGHYDWHLDVGQGQAWHRKLSWSIQMSDPRLYEGGDLRIIGGSNKASYPANTMKGSMTIFPSFLQHKVFPVTKGTRRSLVGWVYGPAWR